MKVTKVEIIKPEVQPVSVTITLQPTELNLLSYITHHNLFGEINVMGDVRNPFISEMVNSLANEIVTAVKDHGDGNGL